MMDPTTIEVVLTIVGVLGIVTGWAVNQTLRHLNQTIGRLEKAIEGHDKRIGRLEVGVAVLEER